MQLFCRYGYEGVTLCQIRTALGISQPSVYASFGSKEQLFREALERYDEISKIMSLSFLARAKSASDAVELILSAGAEAFVRPDGGRGCMILTGSIGIHPDNEKLATDVARRRGQFVEELETQLDRWLPAQRAQILARSLVAVLQGMAVQAHDGASREQLHAIAGLVATGLVSGFAGEQATLT